MFGKKTMLGIGVLAIALSMSACEKTDAPKAPIMRLTEFGQKIGMESPLKAMKPGQTATAAVTITNISTQDWPAGGASPVHLSYHWIDRSGKVAVFEGERTVLPKDLNAGGSVKVQATIKAPDQPGDYVLRMTMVQESVNWFDDRGAKALNLPVTIK